MIDIGIVFWVLVSFAAFSAMMRGWANELVVIAGLMLSPLVVVKFGYVLLRLFSFSGDANQIRRKEFYLLCLIHLVIVYFSYKGPLLADRVSRKGMRPRDNILDRMAGIIAGGVSGYLSVGMIWSLLEYRIIADGIEAIEKSVPYPFDSLLISRPIEGTLLYISAEGLARLASLQNMVTYLPLPVIWPFALLAVVVAMIFIIVVIV